MYDYLEAKRYGEAEHCEVFVETLDAPPNQASRAVAIDLLFLAMAGASTSMALVMMAC